MKKLFPYAICNLLVFTEVRWKNSWPKKHARNDTVQRFSSTLFTRNSLVLSTLHELLRNKEPLDSAAENITLAPKVYIHICWKVCPLLGSNGSYSISLLHYHQSVSGMVQKLRQAATCTFYSTLVACTFIFRLAACIFLFRLDPVAKGKTNSKIEISDHINTMMYSKVTHRSFLLCGKNNHACFSQVKYVTESRRNNSIHLCQAYRPGTRLEGLQNKRITKLNTEGKLMKIRDKL